MSISLIQKTLKEEGIDGWLMYDFHKSNDLMWQILKLSEDTHITRRIFYWIPAQGEPIYFIHAIEEHSLRDVEGKKSIYRTREDLKEALKRAISGTIAMEVSSEIPTISKVDAGTFGLVKGLGVNIVSSARLLQKLTSPLTDQEIKLHLEAAEVVSQAADDAFSYIRSELFQERSIYEGDVAQFILNRFTEEGCVTEYSPIVATGQNSSNPHYSPQGRGHQIKRGDFVLIDLWCKKRDRQGVYADITRVAMTKSPTVKIQKTFNIVRKAQKMAVSFIESSQKPVRGCDVDQLIRDYFQEEGYANQILHRLGHNITHQLHGNGANLDSFETMDERELIDRTCYSIEPALYFPGEFGLRLEHNILIIDKKVQVTGGVQDELLVLLD